MLGQLWRSIGLLLQLCECRGFPFFRELNLKKLICLIKHSFINTNKSRDYEGRVRMENNRNSSDGSNRLFNLLFNSRN